jgi:hypothetical protein
MLTDNFEEVSHDKHLRVDFSPARIPERPAGPPDRDAVAQHRKDMEKMNCGFDKVEILSGNLGYLKFDMFADPGICGPTAVAAMNFLAHVDAIIFDLRENGGGDPKNGRARVKLSLRARNPPERTLGAQERYDLSILDATVCARKASGRETGVRLDLRADVSPAPRSSATTSKTWDAPPSLARPPEAALIPSQVTASTTIL